MTKKPKVTKRKAQFRKWCLTPDVHAPFHNAAAVDLMLRACKAAKYTNVVIGGDFSDFFAVSSHPKPPDRKSDLAWEVEESNALLDQFDKVFTGRKKFVAGNHEDRLTRYLMTRAPELFTSFKIPDLFRLQQRGWAYTPYKSHTYVGKLAITHDTGKAGRYAHYSAGADFQGNVVINHIHRIGYAVEGTATGTPHVMASFGWLGDVEQVDYMHRIKALRDWATGFGTALEDIDTGEVFVEPHPIVNGRVLLDGVVYS